MNKYLKTFLKNALLSGIFVGFTMMLLEYKFVKLSGFVYGAIPFGFLYILIVYFFKNIDRSQKVHDLLHFTSYSIVGGVMFLVIMGAYHYALKFTSSFICSTLALILASIVSVTLVFCNIPHIN